MTVTNMPVFIVLQTQLAKHQLADCFSIGKLLNLAISFQFDFTWKLFVTAICHMLSVFFLDKETLDECEHSWVHQITNNYQYYYPNS